MASKHVAAINKEQYNKLSVKCAVVSLSVCFITHTVKVHSTKVKIKRKKAANVFQRLHGTLAALNTQQHKDIAVVSNIPYPTAFPYGNGMVLHFYQQQESSTTKTVHKVINKGLKTYV